MDWGRRLSLQCYSTPEAIVQCCNNIVVSSFDVVGSVLKTSESEGINFKKFTKFEKNSRKFVG